MKKKDVIYRQDGLLITSVNNLKKPITINNDKEENEERKIEVKPQFGTAICPSCGKNFDKHRQAQKACSTLCRNRYYWILHPVNKSGKKDTSSAQGQQATP
jgi:hypothetical protein